MGACFDGQQQAPRGAHGASKALTIARRPLTTAADPRQPNLLSDLGIGVALEGKKLDISLSSLPQYLLS